MSQAYACASRAAASGRRKPISATMKALRPFFRPLFRPLLGVIGDSEELADGRPSSIDGEERVEGQCEAEVGPQHVSRSGSDRRSLRKLHPFGAASGKEFALEKARAEAEGEAGNGLEQ